GDHAARARDHGSGHTESRAVAQHAGPAHALASRPSTNRPGDRGPRQRRRATGDARPSRRGRGTRVRPDTGPSARRARGCLTMPAHERILRIVIHVTSRVSLLGLILLALPALPGASAT